MKKVIILLVLLPMILLANNKNLDLLSQCKAWTIDALQYDSDDTITIWISGHNYYTNNIALQPLLFQAPKNRKSIVIFTQDCFDGGGFSHVSFYN